MSDKAAADRFTVLSDVEHVLQAPSMYVGACEPVETDLFVCVDGQIVNRHIQYSAGLERIYEEILLNAFDQTVREGTGCTEIAVSVDRDTDTITVYNNGAGIPVVMKEELGCYVPEMIFGMLRSGSNYNKSAGNGLVGGQNGLGSKLCIILSDTFTLETVDAVRKKRYIQTWTDNMSAKTKPLIKSCVAKPFTRITFHPDLTRLGVDRLTDDAVMLMKKRLIDISFSSHAGVKVSFDGIAIPIKRPDDYVKLYTHLHLSGEKPIIDSSCERWTVGVALSSDGFQHASFVNGVQTLEGGTHLDHVVGQITKEIIDKLKAKKIVVKPSDVKNRMFVFVRAGIENPKFNSQTKDSLKMPKSAFGSEFVMSDAFRKKLHTSTILKSMLAVSETKTMKDLSKTNGVKTSRLTDMPTLEDAAFAGTKNSLKARLILTEGLSARTFAISAMNVIGRDCYGVFPLKGKLLNVRNVPIAKVSANEEIRSIVKILGLKYELTYEADAEMRTLRYGGVVALTDSDADGYHISGLIINFFHHFWPHLLTRGFLSFCITPIAKVYRGKDVITFYTLNSYEKWVKEATGSFRTKYFKGLGTSTAAEAREALDNIDQKLVTFDRDEVCDETVSMVFDKKRADDRKDWLMTSYDPESCIDRNERRCSVSDFINYELSHFSTYDCERSIPNVMDGLKTSQRKILHVSLKFVAKNEMKVAQLAPKVSELTDYHHGEQSLMGAIINMATDYVGTNNINLLMPLGAFGTRLNGNDAASPRYIFTKLNPVTAKIFDARDTELLTHLESDGVRIEPKWFAPALPMILINGALGIATGFSTSVLQYNPKDLIVYLKAMLRDEKPEKNLSPWYRGFKGAIEKDAPNKYTTYAVWAFNDKTRTMRVTELPIGVWTDTYKAFCEQLLAQSGSPLIDVRYGNTDVAVDFELVFKPETFETFKDMPKDQLVKTLHLSSKLNSTNMHLFDAEGRIRKFGNVYSIVKYYYVQRLALYERRREALIARLRYEILILENKSRFIMAVKDGKIDQRAMTEASLLEALVKDFAPDPASSGAGMTTYEYLVGMSYRSFTNENAARMQAVVKEKQLAMKRLEKTTPAAMWIEDLVAIEAALA